MDILNDAIRQLLNGSTRPNLRMKILAWMKDAYSDKPFSFAACCRAAGKTPETHRKEILSRLSLVATPLLTTERG